MILEWIKYGRGYVCRVNCDSCQIEFRRAAKWVRRTKHQFCSRICFETAMRSEGLLHEEWTARYRQAAALGREALQEKYGVTSPMQIPSTRAKLAVPLVERYGEEKARDIRDRIKQTNLERRGVTCPFNQPHVRARANSSAAQAKKIETRKRNGKVWISKAEDDVVKELLKEYSVEEVLRQITLNGWSMDVFIVPRKTFVQVDGVYWHGLNRPIEVIRESTNKTDQHIYRKYLLDLRQNEWFASQAEYRLVRVTDVQINEGLKAGSLRDLLSALGILRGMPS